MHTSDAFAPDRMEYLPATHAIQALEELAPDRMEYFPAPQSLQACVPAAPLNLPAAHGAHASPPGPVGPEKPGLHAHDA